ncbi:MAG: hypothetical protein N2Z74_01020 [Syntrophales bacterium]|nr:hypothetical protein [Syntrophales bacterium]
MGTILKGTKGVLRYELEGQDLVNVTFDDKFTDAATIKKNIEKGNFTVEGKPKPVRKPTP